LRKKLKLEDLLFKKFAIVIFTSTDLAVVTVSASFIYSDYVTDI